MKSRVGADLRSRSAALGFSVPVAIVDRLAHYGDTLQRWSERLNLTGFDLSHGFSAAALDRLLIEPIAASRLIPEPLHHLVDLGSGGGSPAIPLALLTSPARLTMIETNRRKVAFLRQATRELGIAAEVVCGRIEEWASSSTAECAGGVSLRAVRLDESTLAAVRRCICPGGWLLRFLPLAPESANVVAGQALEVRYPALGTKLQLARFSSSPS